MLCMPPAWRFRATFGIFIIEIVCVGTAYMPCYILVLTWDLSCPLCAYGWRQSVNICSTDVVFLPLCYFIVFLHGDWRLTFEMKVPMPIAVADIANRSQSSFLLTPELCLRMLCKSGPGRGLLYHLLLYWDMLANLRKYKEKLSMGLLYPCK